MTTIAYKDGCMAADTLALDPNGLKDYITKIHEVEIDRDVWVFGSAGTASIMYSLLDSLRGVENIKQVLDSAITCDPNDDNSAMLCRGDVIINKIGKRWKRITHRNFHALGSGRDFALMAMYLGKRPIEAVELACGFDGYSGGDIDVVTTE